VNTAEVQVTKQNEGGFYAIPPEALGKLKVQVVVVDLMKRRDSPSIQRDVTPVLPPAFAGARFAKVRGKRQRGF